MVECSMIKAAAAVIQHYYGQVETDNGTSKFRDMNESDDQEWLLNTRQCGQQEVPLAVPMRSQGRSVAIVHVIPDNMAKGAM